MSPLPATDIESSRYLGFSGDSVGVNVGGAAVGGRGDAGGAGVLTMAVGGSVAGGAGVLTMAVGGSVAGGAGVLTMAVGGSVAGGAGVLTVTGGSGVAGRIAVGATGTPRVGARVGIGEPNMPIFTRP